MKGIVTRARGKIYAVEHEGVTENMPSDRNATGWLSRLRILGKRKVADGLLSKLRQGKVLSKLRKSGFAPRIHSVSDEQDPSTVAKLKARGALLAEQMEDLKFIACSVARAAHLRAKHKLETIIKEKIIQAKQRMETEIRRRLHEKMKREITARLSKAWARNMYDTIIQNMMYHGLERILAHRDAKEMARFKSQRAQRGWEILFTRCLRRDRAKVFAQAVLYHSILQRHLMRNHKTRCRSALMIQCAWRTAVARRDFLLALIEMEDHLCRLGREYVAAKWKSRLASAWEKLQQGKWDNKLEWTKRRVFARQEYWRPKELPRTDEDRSPNDYHGAVAFVIPNTNAQSILLPLGAERRELDKLKWIGIPVGVKSTCEGANKRHFQFVHQPLRSSLLGLSLETPKHRAEAQNRLDRLKALANDPAQQAIRHASALLRNNFDKERVQLWGEASLL